MKKTALVIAWFVLPVSGQCQDLHFTQTREHPALINPALTGAAGGYRGNVGYRSQWGSITSPYRTFGASAELRFKPYNWEQVEGQSMTFKESMTGRVGAGFSVYGDEAGDGRMGTTLSNLSLSSFIPMNRYSFIAAGIQGTFGQRRIYGGELVFPDQFNGKNYDPAIMTREKLVNENYVYGDCAAGLLAMYDRSARSIGSYDQLRANFGVSVYHLARPRYGFTDAGHRLPRRLVVHGEVLTDIRETSFAFESSFNFQLSGPSRELLLGLFLRNYFSDDAKYTGFSKKTSVAAGVYYRNRDAIAPAMMIEWKDQYAIGISYDLNISSLASTSRARGGFELTLRVSAPRAYLYEMK